MQDETLRDDDEKAPREQAQDPPGDEQYVVVDGTHLQDDDSVPRPTPSLNSEARADAANSGMGPHRVVDVGASRDDSDDDDANDSFDDNDIDEEAGPISAYVVNDDDDEEEEEEEAAPISAYAVAAASQESSSIRDDDDYNSDDRKADPFLPHFKDQVRTVAGLAAAAAYEEAILPSEQQAVTMTLLPTFKDQVQPATKIKVTSGGNGDDNDDDNNNNQKQNQLPVPNFKDQAQPTGFDVEQQYDAASDNAKNLAATADGPMDVLNPPDSFSAINYGNNNNTNNNNQNVGLYTTLEPVPVTEKGQNNYNTEQQVLASHHHHEKRRQVRTLAFVAGIVAVVVAAVVIVVMAASSNEDGNDAITIVRQKLMASDGARWDQFGHSVATDGDTIVIGSFEDEALSIISGSAFVYTRFGKIWTEQAKLTASDGAAEDNFGRSVAIDGDTLVIGADGDTENGFGSGSAHVYTRSGSVWTEQAILTASDGGTWDRFGHSVAIDGDNIVIGAYRDKGDSGSAYVYTHFGTDWTEQAKLMASDGTAEDYFGESVAIDRNTIVIGASGIESENAFYVGSVYVFTLSGMVWTEEAKLTASDGAELDQFGNSVAIDGETIVIGAELDDTANGNNSGSAYVYTHFGTVWTEQAKLTANDGAADDRFGWSVAVYGSTIVIGAWADDTENGEYSGSAYVYTHFEAVWTELAKLTATDGADGDKFGISVAIDRDIIVIGASKNREDVGSVYIF